MLPLIGGEIDSYKNKDFATSADKSFMMLMIAMIK